MSATFDSLTALLTATGVLFATVLEELATQVNQICFNTLIWKLTAVHFAPVGGVVDPLGDVTRSLVAIAIVLMTQLFPVPVSIIIVSWCCARCFPVIHLLPKSVCFGRLRQISTYSIGNTAATWGKRKMNISSLREKVVRKHARWTSKLQNKMVSWRSCGRSPNGVPLPPDLRHPNHCLPPWHLAPHPTADVPACHHLPSLRRTTRCRTRFGAGARRQRWKPEAEYEELDSQTSQPLEIQKIRKI